MAQQLSAPTLRKQALMDAAVRIVAQHGLRALTHRAIDKEAQVPAGSTSYHAPTREALLRMIVEWLVVQSSDHAQGGDRMRELVANIRKSQTIDELVGSLVDVSAAMASKPDELRARYALLLELEDPELIDLLGLGSPIRTELTAVIALALERLGIDQASTRAEHIYDTGDSLLWQEHVLRARPDRRAVLGTFLTGLATTSHNR